MNLFSADKRFSTNTNQPTANNSPSPISEKRAAIVASKKSSATAPKRHVNQNSVPMTTKTQHAKGEWSLSVPPPKDLSQTTLPSNPQMCEVKCWFSSLLLIIWLFASALKTSPRLVVDVKNCYGSNGSFQVTLFRLMEDLFLVPSVLLVQHCLLSIPMLHF